MSVRGPLGARHRRLARHREGDRAPLRRTRRWARRDRLHAERHGCRAAADDLRGVGAEPVFIRGNMTSEQRPAEIENHGPWNVVVHNAATGVIRPALETEDKHWDWTLAPTPGRCSRSPEWRRPPCRRAPRSSGSPASGRRVCWRTTCSSEPRRRPSSHSSAISPSNCATRDPRQRSVWRRRRDGRPRALPE